MHNCSNSEMDGPIVMKLAKIYVLNILYQDFEKISYYMLIYAYFMQIN